MPEASLTDTPPRPSPNENHLLINAYTTHPESPLLSVTRRIADSGCNLVDARLSTVGRDVSVTALAQGSWDSVAKLEAMLARLEREEGLKLVWYRSGGEVSDRQWLDILNVLALQTDNLDWAYLRQWANELGVGDLLSRASTQSASDSPTA